MSTIKKSCCDGNYVFGGEHHSVECKTEIHKPNAAMYGLCQKCRDYFDGKDEVEDRGDDSSKYEREDDDAEHWDMERNDEQARLDADESRE